MRKVTAGVIDDNARHAFTHGACGALAVAIHDTTGWPIIAVGKCDGLDMHYAVRRPDGLLVDIEGAHSDDDMRDAYALWADDDVTLTPISRAEVWEWWVEEGQPIPMDVVRSIAAAVLNELAGAPVNAQ